MDANVPLTACGTASCWIFDGAAHPSETALSANVSDSPSALNASIDSDAGVLAGAITVRVSAGLRCTLQVRGDGVMGGVHCNQSCRV
jgi:hypothetical protein